MIAATPEKVLAALQGVADPEIPAVSIVELGRIGEVEVGADRIHVELVPTFVGCPAIEMIRSAVEDRLSSFHRPVDVEVSWATPWSSDRISPAGRLKLRRSGFAPPPPVRPGRALQANLAHKASSIHVANLAHRASSIHVVSLARKASSIRVVSSARAVGLKAGCTGVARAAASRSSCSRSY